MSRELYQLLRRTIDKSTETMEELEDFCKFTKVELPPIYYSWEAIKVFCEFLLDNEEVKNENIK